MLDLNKDVKFIKGVGPARAKLLNSLGIFTLGDLITYFPRDYEDRGKPKNIAEVEDGEEVLIEAICVSKIMEKRIRKNMVIYKLSVRDETGLCHITWFNQRYLKNRFKLGETYKFFGKVQKRIGFIEMNSPVFDSEDTNKNTGKIIPLYPLTYNLSQNVIRQVMENALKEVNEELQETMPEYLLKEYNLDDINKAIQGIHFPENFEEYNKAKKRLVFEELLVMQLALLNLKTKYSVNKKGIEFDKRVNMSDVIEQLPFNLTKAQARVLEEIDKDMESENPMNRLLQGDVGSR
jgi:ATP-dependent DNA helicase RecG